MARDGRSYRRAWERDLTSARPPQPAAVLLHSAGGEASVLALDLDVGRGGVEAVERDRDALVGWLTRVGARCVVDRSPTGGVHVYVPLAAPVPFEDSRALVEALAARTPTLDPGPHQNVVDGCIRPPGAAHKSGGHQVLETPLTLAYDVLRRRNPARVWEAMRTDLVNELAAVRDRRTAQPGPVAHSLADVEHLPRVAGPVRMPLGAHQIAVSGDFDRARYRSPSEARQAVVTAAVAAGWQLVDVATRLESGRWPGLASFYARYRPGHRRKALVADWRNAVGYVRSKHPAAAPGTGMSSNAPQASSQHSGGTHHRPPELAHAPRAAGPRTTPDNRSLATPPTQRRATDTGSSTPVRVHQQIRAWRNAVSSLERRRYRGRQGLVRRLVLRALAEAAHKTGTTTVEMGVRSLAIATGQHHTTVAAHLRALREEPDPFLVLIEAGRGTSGDLYELRVPEAAAAYAASAAWRPGKVHALRPAFRELGTVAAYVYEAIETSSDPAGTLELTKATGMARSAVTLALDTLAAWGLVERRHGRWHLRPEGCLFAVAEQLGVLEAVAEQITRYRAERAAWRAWLSRHAPHPTAVLRDIELAWPAEPSRGDPVTLHDLAHT